MIIFCLYVHNFIYRFKKIIMKVFIFPTSGLMDIENKIIKFFFFTEFLFLIFYFLHKYKILGETN